MATRKSATLSTPPCRTPRFEGIMSYAFSISKKIATVFFILYLSHIFCDLALRNYFVHDVKCTLFSGKL